MPLALAGAAGIVAGVLDDPTRDPVAALIGAGAIGLGQMRAIGQDPDRRESPGRADPGHQVPGWPGRRITISANTRRGAIPNRLRASHKAERPGMAPGRTGRGQRSSWR